MIPPAIFGASLGMVGFGNAFQFWSTVIPGLDDFTQGVLVFSRCMSVIYLILGITQIMVLPRRQLELYLGPDHVTFAPGFMAVAFLLNILHGAGWYETSYFLFLITCAYAFAALFVFVFVVRKCELRPEPAWFPVIVGIGALADPGSAAVLTRITLVCPASLAQFLLWWAAVWTVLLAPIITYRLFRSQHLVRNQPGALVLVAAGSPSAAILVAPFSLTQLAWWACFSAGLEPSRFLVHAFYGGSFVFSFVALAALWAHRKIAFPLHQAAAYTFPLAATTATACKYWQMNLMDENWSAVDVSLTKAWSIVLLITASIVIPCYNAWFVHHIVTTHWGSCHKRCRACKPGQSDPQALDARTGFSRQKSFSREDLDEQCPVQIFEGNAGNTDEEKGSEAPGCMCAICLAELEVGDEIRTLSCPAKHSYHAACVESWHLSASQPFSCPFCRHAIVLLVSTSDTNDEVCRKSDVKGELIAEVSTVHEVKAHAQELQVV